MAQLDRLFTGFILLFVLTFLALGYFYYQYSWDVLYFPFFTGIAVICLCIFNLLHRTSDQTAGQPPQPNVAAKIGAKTDAPQATGTCPGILWVLVSIPFVFVFGYLLGFGLYMLVFLRAHGQSWTFSLTMSVATLIVIYLGFMSLLRVSLPLFPLGMG